MISHKKNTAYYLSFPAIDSTTPASYKSGLSPVDTAYYKDGAGAWTSLAIADTATEIGSTGVYEIDLSASELNHDKVFVKFSVSGMADDGYMFDLTANGIDDLATPTNITAATGIVLSGVTHTGAVIPTVSVLTGHTPQTADHTAAIADIPTNAEFNAKLPNNLNTTALGNIGIDWANIENPTTAQNLSATNIDVDQVVASVTGSVGSNLELGPAEVTAAVPTALENADALLNRDMSAISDTTARSPLNALRFLRNKWSVSGATLTVTKEDDATSAWTATVTTDATADPITGNDPA
jgi:hypothetical protein